MSNINTFFKIFCCFSLPLFSWYFVSAQVYQYQVGSPCAANENVCPHLDMCITNAPTPDGHVCSCRLVHLRSNYTWRANYTNCTMNYSPWGTHPMENGKVVDFPFFSYERVPEDSFISNGDYDDVFLPRYARLNSYIDKKGGWCAPTAPAVAPSGEEYFLVIDLGNITRVSGVVTQGRSGVRFAMAVTSFQLEYGLDNTTYITMMNGSSPHVFEGNTNNDIPVYNFITPHIQARFLKFIPMTYINMKCMRIDVLGLKLVNECVNGWNQCDKKAKCTDTIDSYYCTCPAGYHDVLGNGFFCMQVNECVNRRPEFRHNCSANADCTDTDGAFLCDCHDGKLRFAVLNVS